MAVKEYDDIGSNFSGTLQASSFVEDGAEDEKKRMDRAATIESF